MFTVRPLHLAKALVVSLFAVFGLSATHASMLSSSSGMDGMSGHGSSSIQCFGICSTGLASEKQDGILRSDNDEEKDRKATYFAVTVVLALIALTFIVKFLFTLSSWRPPDLIRLHGSFLFYA